MALQLDRKKSVFFLTLSTLWSKVFGFLRELLTAYYFGAGIVKDAFTVSQAIPSRLGTSVYNAVNSSLLPYLIHLKEEQGEEAFWEAYSSIYRWLLVMLILFVAALMLFPSFFVAIMAPGFYQDPQRLSLTLQLIRFTAVVFLLQVLSSMQITLLQIFNNFVPLIASQLLASPMAVVVLFVAGLFNRATPTALALSALASGIATFAVAYTFALPLRQRFKKKPLWGPHVSGFVKFLMPVLAGQLVVISYTLVDQLMASYLPVGNISALNYSSLLYNLPVTLFAIPVINVLYPALSSAAAQDDLIQLKTSFFKGFSMIWAIVLPAAAGLALLAYPIVALIYMRGAFGQSAALLVSQTLFFYSLGIPFLALQNLLNVAFLSEKDNVTPLRASLVGVVLNALLNYLFGFVLAMHAPGFALGTAISWTTIFTVMHIKWSKRHHIPMSETLLAASKPIISTAVMTVVLLLWLRYMPHMGLWAIVTVAIGAVVYGLTLVATRDHSAAYITDLLLKRLGKV